MSIVVQTHVRTTTEQVPAALLQMVEARHRAWVAQVAAALQALEQVREVLAVQVDAAHQAAVQVQVDAAVHLAAEADKAIKDNLIKKAGLRPAFLFSFLFRFACIRFRSIRLLWCRFASFSFFGFYFFCLCLF